jgi:ribosomal-protein-alanine N-acetyltransferase
MILETPRLRLEPFSTAVAADHARLYADPEVTRFLGGGPVLPAEAPERSRRTLEGFVAHWARHGFGVWALRERPGGTFVGQCGLRYIPAEWQLGPAPEVEVLYALARAHWGRGLAREAAAAAVGHGLEVLGLRRIMAVTRPEHVASRRVLEAVGLRYEKHVHIFGMDCVYYAIESPGETAAGPSGPGRPTPALSPATAPAAGAGGSRPRPRPCSGT